MTIDDDPEYRALLELSARAGADPDLVQAAGGNTSLKSGRAMWIKASGTWLSDALERSIMVPVEHEALAEAVRSGDPAAEQAMRFVVKDLAPTDLRPSIETVVHAVMPQRVVVHVHCVQTIALAVRADGEARVAERLRGMNFAWIPYVRPGLPLARAIVARMHADTDILVLGNHGLVVAADTVAQADTLLNRVCGLLAVPPREAPPPDEAALQRLAHGSDYVLPTEPRCHAVATDLVACQHAAGGAFYPDHVIFLGPGSVVAEPGRDAASVVRQVEEQTGGAPAEILFPGKGVLVRRDISAGALAMARCLCDVTTRIPEGTRLHYFSNAENAELLGWDAEKYRQALNRSQVGGEIH